MVTAQDAGQLAKRGIPVFPLRAGTKAGFINGLGDHGATTDPIAIYDMFAGKDLNVGCWAGGRVIFIDIDSHKGGDEAWDALIAEIGDVPQTFTVRSARGGRHLAFDNGGELFGQTPLVKGKIDVRAAGGYVVGPGSWWTDPATGVTGTYTVIDDAPIAPLPDNLSARLRRLQHDPTEGPKIVSKLDTPDAIAAARRRLASRPPAIEGKSGDQQTYDMACQILDLGLSVDKAYELMLEIYNPRCVPPWEPDNLRTKIENAWEYKQDPIGRDNPSQGFTPVPPHLLPDRTRNAEQQTHGISIEWVDELAADAGVDWLVDEVIPKVSFGYMVADPSAGKTQLAVQLAVCGHYQFAYFGREIAERFGTVIVAAEGAYSIGPRVRASAAHGFADVSLPDGAELNRWPIVRVSEPPDLLSEKGLQSFIQYLKAVDAAMQQRYGVRLGLVIIDTFAATFAADEDKASEVSAATRAMRDIASSLRIAVLATHHYGKNKERGMRGSTAHRANADFVLSIPKQGELWLDKCRDAEAGIPLGHFVLRAATLGKRANGKPDTSIYAECTPSPRRQSLAAAGEGFTVVPDAKEMGVNSPKRVDRAAEALLTAFNRVAHGNAEAPMQTVRAEFVHGREGNKAAARQHFKRALEKSIKAGALKKINRGGQDYLMRPPSDFQ